MQPNLIPHTFTAKNLRKRYHRRCAERTWNQWLNDYQNALQFVAGLAFVLLILYLRYRDKADRASMIKRSQSYSSSQQTNSDNVVYQPHTLPFQVHNATM